MSHKSKKHRRFLVSPGPPRPAKPSRVPVDFDLDEFERKNALREARHEELRYRIAPDCKVHIQFKGIATQDAIRKLIGYLEMGMADFPKNVDDSATQD